MLINWSENAIQAAKTSDQPAKSSSSRLLTSPTIPPDIKI